MRTIQQIKNFKHQTVTVMCEYVCFRLDWLDFGAIYEDYLMLLFVIQVILRHPEASRVPYNLICNRQQQ